MSKLSRYNLLISLIRSELRCEHSLGNSSDAVKHNHLLTSKSLEAWIFLIEDLMCENDLSEQARNTRITKLIAYLNDHHISLTLALLKKTYDILIDHISQKRVLVDYLDFKGLFDVTEWDSIGLLFSPIKESLNAVIISQTVVSSGIYKNISKRDMWICAHFLQFLNKINYQDVGLEAKALSDYYDAENETASLNLDNCNLYIPALQSILKSWMKDWNYDGSRPKHGPGSVADADRDKLSKYYALTPDTKIRYLYKEDDPNIFPKWRRQGFERCSKLVFVPKNITKLRSISMEPATLQYLQQGCMESLYNYFAIQPELRKILKLADQHQNKSFAYHGSITNDYATIDLSHASDSLNWKLVKVLFKRVPELVKWLVCTRSTHTLLPDGSKILLTKFAPMGSALCFPIETLVFAAIAKLSISIAREQALDRNNDTGIRSNTCFLTVYGDDIILPSYAAQTCIRLLQLFGFTPNESKSYLDGPFKESCGGNFFCGYDITALKYTPDFDASYQNGMSPNAYAALCSYANLAYDRGLYLFRLYCIKQIFESGLQPLFTDTLDESPKIYSPTPTNFHLKKVYRKRYQKFEYLYTGVKSVEKATRNCDEIDEEIFLFDRLLQYDRRKEGCHLPLINAIITNGVVRFDFDAPYSRNTLLPQVLKYTLCKTDV